MPAAKRKSQRASVRNSSSNSSKRKDVKKPFDSSRNKEEPTTVLEDVDFATTPSAELWASILERNTDPVIERMVLTLKSRLPHEATDAVEAKKRIRSIVICGLSEWGLDQPLCVRQKDLEEKMANILDSLEVDCLLEVI
ncbi:hypothetical protein ANCDUO_24337 [Ancylostoma duodenale]|uniref:Uncharacterized protein n=1 Tax=Ancylostoma duodenale TaxID=51022 RepID=A0A0C2C7I9_9BILA|nr:hypothetical protein ANCDUO_24337 [Ancylostoma duodenale]